MSLTSLAQDREEFASHRRVMLQSADSVVGPAVSKALRRYRSPSWFEPILDAAERIFRRSFRRETGTNKHPDLTNAVDQFRSELRGQLLRTKFPPDDGTAARLTKWISTASTNAGTDFATRTEESDPDTESGRGHEWVTMHDNRVRVSHHNTDGQVQPVGQNFWVGPDEAGALAQMRYPGDPRVAPSFWIHCRCVLRPVASTSGGTVSRPLLADGDLLTDEAVGAEPPVPEDKITGEPIPWHGVLAPEGVMSGDRRRFAKESLRWRDLPLPLSWQKISDDGHKGSVVVARIDRIFRDGNLVRGEGVWDSSEDADEALRQVAEGMLRGVSVDIDDHAMTQMQVGDEEVAHFTAGRICGATLVSIPAFQEAFVALGTEGDNLTEDPEDQTNAAPDVGSGQDGEGGVALMAAAPPARAATEAKRGLAWHKDGHSGSGLEPATVARAQMIADREDLSDSHIKRMKAFFDRHQVDKKGKDWSPGSDGYPSPGRVAWALWGGDPGWSWATKQVNAMTASGQEFADAEFVSEKPWDGSASRFTDEQYYRSTILHKNGSSKSKSDNSLPIREPNGELSRAAVHSAAGMIGKVKGANADQIASAKRALRGAYKQLGEDPPDSISASIADVDGFSRGPGWVTAPEATRRIHAYWTRGAGAAKIAWGVPGDFNRCRAELAKYVEPRFLNGTCAQWHHDALGFWPGHPTSGDTEAFENCEECDMADAVNLVASAATITHRAEFFENPNLIMKSPLVVSREGRVFGHLASWDECHIGIGNQCVKAPRSATNYAYFKTGSVLTDIGEIPTGKITLGGGHADAKLGYIAAAEHYDSTSAVVADVTAGEDEFGIWVSGQVRPGTSDDKIVAMRAAPLSGDWRNVGGNLELVAALSVNVPGFPIPHASLAASGEKITALTAAGVVEPSSVQVGSISNEGFASAVVDEMELRARTKRMNTLRAGRAKQRMAALAASARSE